MKKIININLSGRVIPIEDTAYESLQRYIESLRRYFAMEEGRDEIINDIESRIAELMNDKIKKGQASITDADILEIINSMGRVEDFEATDAETISATEATAQSSTETRKGKRAKGRLFRDSTDKFIGGVCSGIANYMDIDPAIVRLLFAIITFGGFGTGIVIYILLWIILPIRHLDTYVGKRLFRNPEDKVISGVAGGLAAYFNRPSWVIRLIFAGPLLLNIMFGAFNGIFFAFQRDIFPNFFIGSFSGTFVLAYIILWIVLPEARSAFEKMEMRGEKVDVNRIRQNVQEGMGSVKNRMEAWGEEVKTTAQTMSARANEFMNTQGKTWASEAAESAKPVARGVGHIIGVLFKAFFIFIAGCLALSLFAVLMVVIFGGVAWWPINNFLWTSVGQKLLAWGTVLFFIAVPLVGFMIWLIRRVVRVRSRNRYLGWTFSGLWVIGWICAICLAASISRDLKSYERVSTDVAPAGLLKDKMIVTVNEPEIRYSGDAWWLRADNTGWDISDDTLKYNNVKVRIDKSADSFYHVVVSKYSAGRTLRDAQTRASDIVFNTSVTDSILNLGSGLTISRQSKFRGQGVIVEIQVPVGKKLRFDESLMHAYTPWAIRKSERAYRNWNRRYEYKIDWDNDEYFNWETNVDYVMTATEGLVDPLAKAKEDAERKKEEERNRSGNYDLQDPTQARKDSLRRDIEKRERQLELDKQRLEQGTDLPDSSTQSTGRNKSSVYTNDSHVSYGMITPLII